MRKALATKAAFNAERTSPSQKALAKSTSMNGYGLGLACGAATETVRVTALSSISHNLMAWGGLGNLRKNRSPITAQNPWRDRRLVTPQTAGGNCDDYRTQAARPRDAGKSGRSTGEAQCRSQPTSRQSRLVCVERLDSFPPRLQMVGLGSVPGL